MMTVIVCSMEMTYPDVLVPKCAACNCRLGEVGSTLFLKKDLILCKTDYLRIFGVKGRCAACGKDIPACEMVMRASNNVYHLECFGCQDCHCRFCVGERFYLDLDNNKILCEDDYKERLLFAQMATYPYGSWDQLKREISQKLEDMDEVAKVCDDDGRHPRCLPFASRPSTRSPFQVQSLRR
ncbi:unnamed protein product [Soboliphyme baturini]|uniref:LIM zinc-binding domain-containing protein n=1 Tax=Soboliphyme baturini TaxID=241478 RepID=A0A183IUT0_9BILA|nr:unnamed protein product [Soboliphyme baturini]